jgi:hypothetical protein
VFRNSIHGKAEQAHVLARDLFSRLQTVNAFLRGTDVPDADFPPAGHNLRDFLDAPLGALEKCCVQLDLIEDALGIAAACPPDPEPAAQSCAAPIYDSAAEALAQIAGDAPGEACSHRRVRTREEAHRIVDEDLEAVRGAAHRCIDNGVQLDVTYRVPKVKEGPPAEQAAPKPKPETCERPVLHSDLEHLHRRIDQLVDVVGEMNRPKAVYGSPVACAPDPEPGKTYTRRCL